MSHLPCKQDPPFTLPLHTHTKRNKEKCPANTSPACELGEVSEVRVYTFSTAHALHITYNRFCEIPRTTASPFLLPPPLSFPTSLSLSLSLAKPNRQSREKGRASYYFQRTPRDVSETFTRLTFSTPLMLLFNARHRAGHRGRRNKIPPVDSHPQL